MTSAFTEEYQNDAFAHNPHLARALVELFEVRFDPSGERNLTAEQAVSFGSSPTSTR